MSRLAGFMPFLALALAVHLGGFAWLAQGAGGSRAAGEAAGHAEGEDALDRLAVEGGDAALQALVAQWLAPPMVEPAAVNPPPTTPPTTPEPAALVDLPPPAPPVPLTAMPGIAPMNAPRAAVEPLGQAAPAIPSLPTPPPPAATLMAALGAAPLSAPAPPPRPDRLSERRPEPQPEPQPEPASSAATTAPAPTVAQAGSTARQGQSGQAAQTSRAAADTGGLMTQWGGAIRAAVQRQQRLPAGLRRSGTVHLRLDVHSSGRLIGVELRQSSGETALDRAAIEAVQRARLPAAPAGLDGAYQFNLPVRFRG